MSYSEEERDEKLKEIERIEGMTPDQAYRESVSTLGRADGITDRMDAAARIPEGGLDALRQTSAVQRTETSAPPASAPAVPPADAGRDISYGIVRADDPGIAEYHKRREAQRSASMAARRAAAAAQQRTRDELLASGRYFDDGRGNLKLRTQFREYTRRGSNGRPYRDILPDDGSGNAAIRNAGQDAYDRTIAEQTQPSDGGRAEAFLRQDQRNADELKAARQRRQSSINLIGSRILAQSLRAMNEPDDNTSGGARYTNGDRNGVEIERGYGTSRLAKRDSGRYKVGGFVSEEQLKEFNDELNAQGADFAVTGVVCQQKKDANGYESGRPHFYIQFRNKNGREFARMYSIEKAYDEARRAFKDHYQGSSDDEADDYAIKAFGDIFGRGAKREEAAQWARGAATNELSAADKRFKLEALKVLQEMDKANKMPVTAEDFYRNNPKLITMLGTDYKRDENGQLVMDEMTGKPIEITLPPEEISKRAVAFFDGLRKSEANGGGTGMNEIQRAIVDGIRALTTPLAKQQTANVPQRGFYYRNRSGGLTATNGYVVGGKAYDRYGNVMQGVQPLDYQGNPISGDAPDDAVVSTPAPAQQQSQQPTREEIQAELARRRAAKAQQQQQPAPLSQPVTSLESPAPARGRYGLRNDGKTYKGTGWLGELKLPNGGVATEYTMQSDAVRDANGNRIDFPSLVPTLTKDEVDLMVNDIIPNNKPVPDAIAQKAVDFARDRMSKGQSVFAN